jgi:bla regulator protein blaR1
MKPLFLCFSENLDYALGWMVVHSLWQATLIAFIAGALNIALRKRSARVRYIVSNVSLLMILAMSVATFCYNYDFSKSASQVVFIPTNETAQAQITEIITPNSEIVTPLSIGGFKDYFNHNLPLIVTIWVLGVALFMLKLLGGVSYIYYLKSRMNFPTDEYWSDMKERLSKQAGIKKSVELVESALVRTPMVIGFLKPMILFPMGVINRLAPQEVEAILAHELAHVLRNDYLFNIMQSVVEALFYFHPAVWWLSGQIRNERESACDEIAIELINSKMNYAKALVTIQEMAYYPMSPAMGFAGQLKNQFILRMQRILNQPNHKSNVMEKLIATLLIVVTLAGLTIGQNQNQPKKEDNKNETPQLSFQNFDSSKPEMFTNITTVGDTIGEPFYSTLPPTPEIIKLQKEAAEMEKEFPLFEKEKEAEIEKLKKELIEMERGIDAYEKEKETEIASIEKVISSMKGEMPKTEKDHEAKIESIMKEIKNKEAELEVFIKNTEAENDKIEAQIVEKKKERDGKTGVKRSSVEGDIQGLYGEIQGNLGEIQGKRGEIQGLYGEIQGIRGELQGNHGELQGKFGEIQGKRGEIMGKRGEIQGKRGEIQGKRGEIQGRRGEIQGKYGEIQGKYSELVLKELVTDLKRDNIIASDSKLYLRLNQKEMFVNEVKQSETVHLKYKAKYLKGNKKGFEIFKRNGNLNFIMDDDN